MIEDARFPEIAAEMLAVDFGIDVAVDEEQIGPAVIVEIEKHDAPAEILRVQSKPGGKGFVVEGAVAVVAVKRGSVVGEIGFEKVEFPVAVIIRNSRSHASLLAAVVVEGGTGDDGDVGKRSVVIKA